VAKPTPSQSGKIANPSAPPFATPGGKPVPVGPQGPNPNGLGAAPPVDAGDSSWDVDHAQTPQGGRVLKADPPSDASGGGGMGNGGNAVPWKNLK
jgi:hypothetical protein